MKYIYGPVKSRRLGLSLGITLTPHKICSFDCIYCQVGQTPDVTIERKEYLSIDEIFAELKSWLADNTSVAQQLDYITLCGAGEPTLNIKIDQLISKIKSITAIPIAVITNASLFNVAMVRQAIRLADLIVPSLDAVTNEVFIRVDRPAENIKIDEIIQGLISLRKEFPGKIWLEVMLVKGINDDLRHIRKLKEAVDKIKPDKVQLNSPVRIGTQKNILPVDRSKLEKIKEILGDNCQII